MALLVKTISTLVAHAPELTFRYHGAVAAWFEGNKVSHGGSNPEPLSSRPWVSKGRSIRLMRHGAGLSTPARWFGRYMPRQVTGTRRTMVATDYWERGLT